MPADGASRKAKLPQAAGGIAPGPAAPQHDQLPPALQPLRLPPRGRGQSDHGNHFARRGQTGQNGTAKWNAFKGSPSSLRFFLYLKKLYSNILTIQSAALLSTGNFALRFCVSIN